MGKIFCQICARSTHHKHISWSPYERGSGQGHFDALWCNLHLYLNLFCVNIIIFYFFSFEHFLWGQFFFWDRRSHGPVDFVGLLLMPITSAPIGQNRHMLISHHREKLFIMAVIARYRVYSFQLCCKTSSTLKRGICMQKVLQQLWIALYT